MITTAAAPCQHETLAQNRIGHVQRCAHCGCISIHVGPMTLRCDDESFQLLSEVFETALAGLRRRREGDAPSWPQPANAPRGMA